MTGTGRSILRPDNSARPGGWISAIPPRAICSTSSRLRFCSAIQSPLARCFGRKRMAGITPQSNHSDIGVLHSSTTPSSIHPFVHEGIDSNRPHLTASDIVEEIWDGLGLPTAALDSISLDAATSPALPSSYRIGCLAQSSIALSALGAALIHSLRNGTDVPKVTVPRRHATVEYKSVQFCTLHGQPGPTSTVPALGPHKTADGHIRIHDAFPNHRDGALRFLGLPLDAAYADVEEKTLQWNSIDLETTGLQNKLALYALRSYKEWDSLPQASAISSFPISVQKIADGSAGLPQRMTPGNDRPLHGLRVLELTRVIAGPLSGRALAAHGADVLWVTSPNLPDLPVVDRDLSRGKRTIQLDIHSAADKEELLHLIRSCDVFIQGYRPGSLAAYGLTPEQLVKVNPNIIIANMSAFGPRGPWSERRGFDSLVQTCSGMNVSEAEHYGGGQAARILPCQALDHGSGYFLATGVLAALYKRAVEGGAYRVDVSLAGTMKYLRSLGQYRGTSGFGCPDITAEDAKDYLETKESAFGLMAAVRHSAHVDGCITGWERMPRPLGSDRKEWLV
ncbi:CoA-transferase family III [Macrophomina phaseolina MS6]|uniref:CoA-transferase family III n=1 Tax=Macrophomina phaseolina (strain MS6) TaxID=1126212 RepID=K2SCB9_MACPH|nr:CoA-transferase family III [Macrophomina phaseolina MS6]